MTLCFWKLTRLVLRRTGSAPASSQSCVAVVTSLIEFGARYPNQAVTGEVLAAILRHIEERFIELYQGLHTEPAHTMTRDKFNRSLAFLDGVIEHLSDATPV